MGDHYFSNQNRPSTAQNFGISQYQHQQIAFKYNTEGGKYSDNMNRPVYNMPISSSQSHYTGKLQPQRYDNSSQYNKVVPLSSNLQTPLNQTHYPGMQQLQHYDSSPQYNNGAPPPSNIQTHYPGMQQPQRYDSSPQYKNGAPPPSNMQTHYPDMQQPQTYDSSPQYNNGATPPSNMQTHYPGMQQPQRYDSSPQCNIGSPPPFNKQTHYQGMQQLQRYDSSPQYNNGAPPPFNKQTHYQGMQQPQRYVNSPQYNKGAPLSSNMQTPNQKHPSMQQRQCYDSSPHYNKGTPPPSYEESKSDSLIRISSNISRYSSARNFGADDKREKEQPTKKIKFSSLFDFPGQSQSDKPPDWSTNNNNSLQKYQQHFQGSTYPSTSTSHQPSTNFSFNQNGKSNSGSLQTNQNVSDNPRLYRAMKNEQYKGPEKCIEVVAKRFNYLEKTEGNWQSLCNESIGKSTEDVEPVKDYDDGNYTNDDSTYIEEHAVRQSELGVERTENELSATDYNDGFTNTEGQFEESDDEGNDYVHNKDGYDRELKQVDTHIVDPSMVKKYEYYPPSPEEMGEMFGDLVIHFFFKIPKNKQETNPFVVICESFRRSVQYSDLQVEDGYDMAFKDRKFCTLRYNGIMMARGVGENKNLKEPRVAAAIELINKLAMTCYSLESKPSYFNRNAAEKMIERGSVPGVYTIVPKEQAPDYDSACKYLELVASKEDSDIEYIFNLKDGRRLKNWANKVCRQFNARIIKDGNSWVGVSRYRTPQYWRDKMLASGSMENEKFILRPPQGIGNLLLKNFDIKEMVCSLRTQRHYQDCTLTNLYGPPGIGPKISKAKPPWERRFGPGKNYRKKENKITKQVKAGVPVDQTRGYKFLTKKQKQRLNRKIVNIRK